MTLPRPTTLQFIPFIFHSIRLVTPHVLVHATSTPLIHSFHLLYIISLSIHTAMRFAISFHSTYHSTATRLHHIHTLVLRPLIPLKTVIPRNSSLQCHLITSHLHPTKLFTHLFHFHSSLFTLIPHSTTPTLHQFYTPSTVAFPSIVTPHACFISQVLHTQPPFT